MDPQVKQAQQLFWEIGRLREQGMHRLAVRKLAQMARIHEELARRLLQEREPDGWADLYAAVTAWGETGRKHDAHRLILEGRRLSALFPSGSENIERQLNELEDWLESLRVVPSLSDFDRPLPAIPVEAA
jgi:hypothetical protein